MIGTQLIFNNLYLTLLSKILSLARNKSKAVTKRAGSVQTGSGMNRLRGMAKVR